MSELLRMEHISKRFGNFYANQDINFSVAKGEVHTLLGENGAGKSTLMNILGGVHEPTEGQILINGKPVRITTPQDAEKYGIGGKLPILIAEKMGPHFAVGDTCYSWAEDTPVYNPDGKEIIARDNEISEMRKDDVSLAYYGCHTDITIPYDELGSIRVIDDEGEMISIIENGRFVLPGTEELNKPFNNLPLNKNIS